jgi:hypothetical protein
MPALIGGYGQKKTRLFTRSQAIPYARTGPRSAVDDANNNERSRRRKDKAVSRQNDEKKFSRSRDKAQKSPGRTQVPIFSFHPTKEQREAIKADDRPISDILDILKTYCEDNCTLTIGYKPEMESMYAIVRTRENRFEDSLAVSAWHSDLATALYALAFCLKNVARDFPENLPSATQLELDW